MMDHDQIRRMLDDHERRLRRLEEAASAPTLPDASSKADPDAPVWRGEALCPVCLALPLSSFTSCEVGHCPMRSA